jgi:hypothetical protein
MIVLAREWKNMSGYKSGLVIEGPERMRMILRSFIPNVHTPHPRSMEFPLRLGSLDPQEAAACFYHDAAGVKGLAV